MEAIFDPMEEQERIPIHISLSFWLLLENKKKQHREKKKDSQSKWKETKEGMNFGLDFAWQKIKTKNNF